MRKLIALILAALPLISIIPAFVLALETATITASETTLPICDVSLTGPLSFGSLTPGSSAGPIGVSVSQVNGNTAATLSVKGQDWNFGDSPTMPVGQTTWQEGASTATALTTSSASLPNLLQPGTPETPATPLTVNFGVSIPAHQAAASYTQTITFTVSCSA